MVVSGTAVCVFFSGLFVYVALHMHDIQRAPTRRQLTQNAKRIPRACSSCNELAIAKNTESKDAKAHASSCRKEKTYVFEGRDPGVRGFMGAVTHDQTDQMPQLPRIWVLCTPPGSCFFGRVARLDHHAPDIRQ